MKLEFTDIIEDLAELELVCREWSVHCRFNKDKFASLAFGLHQIIDNIEEVKIRK